MVAKGHTSTETPKDEKRDQRNQGEALMAQARAELGEIKAALSKLSGNSAVRDQLRNAAAEVSIAMGAISSAMQSGGSVQLSSISLPSVSAITGEIAASDGIDAVTDSNGISITASIRETIKNNAIDIFDKDCYEPYLKFNSEKERQTFHAEQQRIGDYVKDQAAKGTDEGDFKAAMATRAALQRAEERGGGAEPEHERRVRENEAAITAAKTRQHNLGHDENIDKWSVDTQQNVTKFLEAKGISDAEITKRISLHKDNPVAAAADLFRRGDADTDAFFKEQRKDTLDYLDLAFDRPSKNGAGVSQVAYHFVADADKPQLQLAMATDTLKAAGVQNTDNGSAKIYHGVERQKPAALEHSTTSLA